MHLYINENVFLRKQGKCHVVLDKWYHSTK